MICRCPEYGTCEVCLAMPRIFDRPLRAPEPAPTALAVYVAGSSRELERVRWAQAAVASVGASLTYDWVPYVERAIASGVPETRMPPAARREQATRDAAGVRACDLLWLLAPSEPTRGAWFELGIACERATRPIIIVSGTEEQRLQSLFTHAPEVAHHTTDNAVVALVAAAVRMRRGRTT